jgi:hypothetical protein
MFWRHRLAYRHLQLRVPTKMTNCVTEIIKWTIFLGIGLSYLSLLYPTRWSLRHFQSIAKAWHDDSMVVAISLAALCVACVPFGCLHWILVGRVEREKKRTESWILFWGLFNSLITLHYVGEYPWLILLAAFRLFDLLHIFIERRAMNVPPRNYGRARVLLLFHYFEVVTIFACVYAFLQNHASPSLLFCDKGVPVRLGLNDLLYFSVSYGTTLGSDVGPCPGNLGGIPFYLRPTVYVAAELFCIIVLTLLELPGMKDHAPNPRGGPANAESTQTV